MSDLKQSKLSKLGYKWVNVSDFFEKIPEIGTTSTDKEQYCGYSGLWCKLIMSVTSFAMTNNAIAVIHGPSNCAWAVRNFTSTNYSLYYGNPFLHMPATDINENDVISGGYEKLLKTLIEVDRDYKPEQICVFNTCSTALIGDDVNLAVKEAQKVTNAKISFIASAGMTAPYLGKAIEECSINYVEMMEKPETIIPNTVNILGQYKESFCKKGKRGKYPDDASELTRLIEALGLKVHRIMVSGNIEMIKTAPQSSLNVISCPTWGIPMAQKMQEQFGTPYLRHSVPTGIESTCRWIRDLATFMDRRDEAETFISKEINEIMPVYENLKSAVKGKIALIECGRNTQTAFARPMALARMLQEVGMTPYLFGLHPLELKAKKMDVDYFMWDGFNPKILDGNYLYQQPININHIIEDLQLN